MKKILSIILLLLSITIFNGCKEKTKLHIYTWADYIDPAFITKFENDNNCKVVIDTFDSNETMFAKLMAGASGYDICCPTEYFIPVLKDSKLIEQLDLTKLTNVVQNFDTRFSGKYDRLQWHIPYAFSCTGILYRKDKFPNKQFNSWNDMFSKDFNGRICMMNDIREVIGIALKENKYSVNSINVNELEKTVLTIKEWKNKVSKMDNEQYKTGIASCEFYVAMGYNSDAIQLAMEMPNEIGFVVPKTGTTSSIDTFVIMKNAKNKDLAYKFLNSLYEMKTAVQNSEYICSPMLIKDLSKNLSSEFKQNPFMIIDTELMDKCENILDIGDNLTIYSKMWDKIKSNR